MNRLWTAGVLALLAPQVAAQQPASLKWSVELGVEGRTFLHDPAFAGQKEGSGLSVSVEPEIDVAIGGGTLRFVPFARWDPKDDERDHADLRELSFRVRHGNLDLLAGVGHVFWGVTESVHLVDIVNQTDLVENPDGEDKLGQPLVNLAWTTPVGVFSGFVLPGFRERTFPGIEGRLRAAVPFATGPAEYESEGGRNRVDAAVRWSLARGPVDVGISHFSGTAREPRFELGVDGESPVLVPVYDLIEQTGIDLSVVNGGMLWKLEAIHQQQRIKDFTATAAGFEYTFASVAGTAWDVGALGEFLWDSRGERASGPFQKDLFIGTRLAANDIAGTELLVAAIVDLEHGGSIAYLEASRRIGESFRLSAEWRMFDGGEPADPLHAFRKDDYLQFTLTRFF